MMAGNTTGTDIMAREPTDIVQLKVRMRERLRAELAAEASWEGHSLNAEIVKRLERSFEPEQIDKKLEHLASYVEQAQQQNREILDELRQEMLRRRGMELENILGSELMEKAFHNPAATFDIHDPEKIERLRRWFEEAAKLGLGHTPKSSSQREDDGNS
jgi:hypothetical protein